MTTDERRRRLERLRLLALELLARRELDAVEVELARRARLRLQAERERRLIESVTNDPEMRLLDPADIWPPDTDG